MDIADHSTTKLSVKEGSALSTILAGIAAANAAHLHYEAREREEKDAGNHFPANYFESAARHQNDLFFALMDALAYLPATNLVEAAAQIGQATCVISTTRQNLPENEEFDRVFREMEATVDRLLHSAMRAIEAHGKFSLEAMGLEALRNARLDPWAETEEVVAKLRAEGTK